MNDPAMQSPPGPSASMPSAPRPSAPRPSASLPDAHVSEVSERYRRLAGAITDKITQVPDACWSNPSPCPGWTARDVVRHLVETHAMFAARVGLSLEPGPAVDSDPLGAWTTASGQMQAFLDDPATAAMQFRGISRVSTLGEAVGRFICFDLSVHGWDLSRATALDERMDSREFATMWDTIHAFGDRLRSVTAFGPAVELPPGSNEQDTLLAFLGRDPR